MGSRHKVESATQTSEIVSENEYDHYVLDRTAMAASPRVVIDTSPAFASVHEAVLRFGGPGFWVPRPYRSSSTLEPDLNEPEMYSLEDQSTTMLKDLNKKEEETVNLLKELELTKRLVEELKSRLSKETQPCEWLDNNGPGQKSKPDHKNKEYAKKDSNNMQCTKLEEHSTIVGLIMKELEHTKLNLNQNTNELAAIRASVESLSKKIDRDKCSIQKNNQETKSSSSSHLKEPTVAFSSPINPVLVSKGLQELNYEAEQFMKTADETRIEILKAMSGIEQTKTCLRLIQMKWVAAKKLEEAAKAAESLAIAEIRAITNSDSVSLEGSQHNKPPRITLSYEEYSNLLDKARKAENRKGQEKLNNMMTLDEVLDRVEVMNRKRVSFDDNVRTFGSDSSQMKSHSGSNSTFRKAFPSNPERDSRLPDDHGNRANRPVSIGDILSEKLVLRDDLDMERQEEDEMVGRGRMSLSHLLRQQREDTTLDVINQTRKDSNGERKKLFSKRKALGLGFVHMPLPLSKSSKNRSQSLN